jgi:hypothetical protein
MKMIKNLKCSVRGISGLTVLAPYSVLAWICSTPERLCFSLSFPHLTPSPVTPCQGAIANSKLHIVDEWDSKALERRY